MVISISCHLPPAKLKVGAASVYNVSDAETNKNMFEKEILAPQGCTGVTLNYVSRSFACLEFLVPFFFPFLFSRW